MATKAARKVTNKLPPKSEEFVSCPSISTRMDWLELEAETAAGRKREAIIHELAVLWKQWYGLLDALPVIQRFLDKYLTKEARIKSGVAESGKKAMDMILSSHEPLAMALGSPEDPIAVFWRGRSWPPRQEDFDRRLANWLRDVIISHDFKKLELLLETLRRIPKRFLRPGVTVGELTRNASWPEAPDWGSVYFRYWDAFWSHVEQNKRLPTKGDLDDKVEVYDPGDASRYRKELGLTGLPHKRRGARN